jgi:hypothetical protein
MDASVILVFLSVLSYTIYLYLCLSMMICRCIFLLSTEVCVHVTNCGDHSVIMMYAAYVSSVFTVNCKQFLYVVYV